MQTGTREQAQSRGSPPDQQQGKTVTAPKTNTARAEEEERCYRLRRGAQSKQATNKAHRGPGETPMASNTPTCFPRSTTSGPGGDPLKGPVSQPSHPRCGHWELTVQGPKTDAGTAQGDPWLPGLPLAQPTLCEGANSVAEKLRQHSISFQTNHSFFFFFFFQQRGKKAYPNY